MEQFGECLGQPVGDRLHHDALVVIILGAELGTDFLAAEATRDGEAANVVLDARAFRSDEIGHSKIVRVLALLLLAKRMEGAGFGRPVSRVHLNVVTNRVGREDANHCLRLQRLVLDDVVEERQAVSMQLLSLLAYRLIVEDLGVATVGVLATKLPDLEEGVPIDVRQQLFKRVVLVHLSADEIRRGRRAIRPADLELGSASLLECLELA
mmetsp:Transcript_25419/g.77122  ORF Transcript_25419/g.77122 Transcript_25419/m.77122 type:complete len:210 (+) Transcript_25419:850-1479(+)